MEQALRKTVTIQPGGRIEITSNDLPSGMKAEVIVFVIPEKTGRHMTDMLGAAKGLYQSPEDVLDWLRKERDQWE